MPRFSTTVLAFALTTFILAVSLALIAAAWFLFAHLQISTSTINPF